MFALSTFSPSHSTMKIPKALLVAASLSCIAYSASAQTTFNFLSSGNIGPDLENQSEEALGTVGGITLTAEGLLGGVSLGTSMNSNASSFGINNPSALTAGDDNDRFDNFNGIESMIFSFNMAGTFQVLDLIAFDGVDEAILNFAGGPTYTITSATSSINGSGSDDFLINQSFIANQLITLSVSSNGSSQNFGLESFTVVPEPNTYALLSGFCALGFVMLRGRSS